MLMHLYKAKATLSDYADLNRRYFKLSDIVLFHDDIVELDLLPKAFVECIGDWLDAEAFRECCLLPEDVEIETIVTARLPHKDALVVTATGMPMSAVEKAGATS